MSRLRDAVETYVPLASCCLLMIGFMLWSVTTMVVWLAMGMIATCFVAAQAIKLLGRRSELVDQLIDEVDFGYFEITTDQITLADAVFPLHGEIIPGVPKGRLSVRGTALRRGSDSILLGLTVQIRECPEGSDHQTFELFVDTACACIADVSWANDGSTGVMDGARQAFRESMRALLGDDQCLCCPIKDSFGRSVGIVFKTGIGDGQYDLVVTRDTLGVCRMEIQFLDMEDDE